MISTVYIGSVDCGDNCSSPYNSASMSSSFGSPESAWAELEFAMENIPDFADECTNEINALPLKPVRHVNKDELTVLRKKCKRLEKAISRKVSSEKSLRMQLRAVNKECCRKVASIRHFWKDCIYNEQKRAGIILKRAMQSSN